MRRAVPALLAIAALGLGGCARLIQSMIAPQQAAAQTAGTVAQSTGASDTVNSFGNAADRLLSGAPTNAAELERIRAEVTRRALAERDAAGSAQADPVRRVPWHPRTAELWPPSDHVVLAAAPPLAERGEWVRFAPLPDGTPAADRPLGLDFTPVRIEPRDQVPHLQYPDRPPR